MRFREVWNIIYYYLNLKFDLIYKIGLKYLKTFFELYQTWL